MKQILKGVGVGTFVSVAWLLFGRCWVSIKRTCDEIQMVSGKTTTTTTAAPNGFSRTLVSQISAAVTFTEGHDFRLFVAKNDI